ncbi:MAG: hypothetical protein IPL23_06070 [Saprospiraceae bacterium]|nr:hypothetical protein [Saprospiraceae bacterium]MBK8634053.1 hypothetical protein [Saprospiraceae bacterium]MBP7642059.1 hypothetical protein [Saprospiraceae bacterium]
MSEILDEIFVENALNGHLLFEEDIVSDDILANWLLGMVQNECIFEIDSNSLENVTTK